MRLFGVYVLRSLHPRYRNAAYVGFTVNPTRRLRQHNGDLRTGGAKRTVRRRPWAMAVLVHGFPTKVAALRFEWALQNPTRTRFLKDARATGQGPVASAKVVNARKVDTTLRNMFLLLTVPPFRQFPLHIHYVCEEAAALHQRLVRRIPLPAHVEHRLAPLKVLDDYVLRGISDDEEEDEEEDEDGDGDSELGAGAGDEAEIGSETMLVLEAASAAGDSSNNAGRSSSSRASSDSSVGSGADEDDEVMVLSDVPASRRRSIVTILDDDDDDDDGHDGDQGDNDNSGDGHASERRGPGIAAARAPRSGTRGAAPSCAVCGTRVPRSDLVRCPHRACAASAHLLCMASHMLRGTPEVLVPTLGPCPRCRVPLVWGDLMRAHQHRRMQSDAEPALIRPRPFANEAGVIVLE